jgi:anti-anti-sigma factor
MPRPLLTVEPATEPDRLVVTGEVEVLTAQQLREAILRFAADHPGPVVLDVQGVAFIDSSGLAALVHAQNQLDDQGRRLELHDLSTALWRTIELAGLTEHLGAKRRPDAPAGPTRPSGGPVGEPGISRNEAAVWALWSAHRDRRWSELAELLQPDIVWVRPGPVEHRGLDGVRQMIDGLRAETGGYAIRLDKVAEVGPGLVLAEGRVTSRSGAGERRVTWTVHLRHGLVEKVETAIL